LAEPSPIAPASKGRRLLRAWPWLVAALLIAAALPTPGEVVEPLDVHIDRRLEGAWQPLGTARGDARTVGRWTAEARDVDALRLELATPEAGSIRLTEIEVLGQPAGKR